MSVGQTLHVAHGLIDACVPLITKEELAELQALCESALGDLI